MRPLTLKTILVAIDPDDPSPVAIETASLLAKAAGAELHAVHAVGPPGPGSAQPDAGGWRSRTEAALHRAGVGDGDASIHVVHGHPADAIRSLGERLSADVIVVGRHRSETRGGPLGGTASALAERAPMPCLVVARALSLPLERVLVPIDRSDTARGALLVGLSWASALRASVRSAGSTALVALHVELPDEAAGGSTSLQVELDTLRREAGTWAGVALEGTTAPGSDAAKTIIDYATADEADLVVIGTRGLGLDETTRMGSVSASVAASLQTPLLLVPPAVWRAHAATA
jgi:nucleotide-binding universal stress UspA family protein